MRNIFPFQEQTDMMFNSTIIYEQTTLHPYAEHFLLKIPQNHPSFVDTYQLLKFINVFVPIFEKSVPQISILQKFIKNNTFKY